MGRKRDWRKPTDYEFTGHLSMGGWAWEFLRRNPLYIRDWKNALAKRSRLIAPRRRAMAQKIVNLLSEGEGEVELFPKGFGVKFKADSLTDKELKFLPIFLKKDPPTSVHSDGAAFKWGLTFNHIIDPEIDSPSIASGMPIFRGVCFPLEDTISELPPLEKGEVAFIFNTQNRITPQLKHCENFLKERQYKLVKDDGLRVKDVVSISDKWPKYLRVLDAKIQNEADSDIAGVIFPDLENNVHSNWAGSRAVKKACEQAKMIVDGGYRQIFTDS